MTTPGSTMLGADSVMGPELLADARSRLPELIDLRRRLHRIPEVGLALPDTQAIVAADVSGLGLEPRLGRSLGSVVAKIEGGRPGPTVLLRADMDGLPLTEDTGLEFASERTGTMHACGHDTHMTMLLGAARLLLARRDALAGRVLLMLQPGEEGFHGARVMLEEGLLETPGESPVVAAQAIHISTMYRSGAIALRAGAMLASSDNIRIVVRGRGGHASAPHRALDPITVAAEIVLALQTAVTRQVDAFDPAVVTIAHIEGGTTTNIVPEVVRLEGTFRTVSESTRTQVGALVRTIAEGIAAAHGASADVEIEAGYPVTVNDAGAIDLAREVARAVAGGDSVIEMAAPIMGAEDFSYVLQRVPGSMVFLGARPDGVDLATAPMNHSNRVVFDEAAMAVGAAFYAGVALRHLAAG
jgi:amidohydrolase